MLNKILKVVVNVALPLALITLTIENDMAPYVNPDIYYGIMDTLLTIGIVAALVKVNNG